MKFLLATAAVGLLTAILHGCGGSTNGPKPTPAPTPSPTPASKPTIPTQRLNSGQAMPVLSIGTWQYNSSVAEAVVKQALKLGFNHIDTAWNYGNQDGVGKGLAGTERSKYFLTTKVPNMAQASSVSANLSAYNLTKQLLEEE